jgi:hypothetical protein
LVVPPREFIAAKKIASFVTELPTKEKHKSMHPVTLFFYWTTYFPFFNTSFRWVVSQWPSNDRSEGLQQVDLSFWRLLTRLNATVARADGLSRRACPSTSK